MTRRPAARRALALAALSALASLAQAAPPRDGDRVFLISTRPVGCSTSPARLASGVYAAERVGASWQKTDATALLQSIDPSTPTVVYVHGNKISAADARQRGISVYRRLVRCATDERPVQFLIFSWSSDKVPGLLRDYREKAARTRPVAAQLAWAIDLMPAEAPVGLLGYSYGARVASGASHLLAGGSLPRLNRGVGKPRPMRAVYLAAAMDACWIAPGRRHGLAMTRLDSLLLTANPRDPAMRLFGVVDRKSDPQALGKAGPRCLDAATASRVRTTNVSGSVGRSHDLYRYLASPGLMRSAWRRLAFADAPPIVAEPTLAAR